METPCHEIIAEHKLGRFGKPDEIAAPLSYCPTTPPSSPAIPWSSTVAIPPVGTMSSLTCWDFRRRRQQGSRSQSVRTLAYRGLPLDHLHHGPVRTVNLASFRSLLLKPMTRK
jgi:hypothetical protein